MNSIGELFFFIDKGSNCITYSFQNNEMYTYVNCRVIESKRMKIIIIIVRSHRRKSVSLILSSFFPPSCCFLIHAIDIVVQHFLLFFAQIGDDTLFPEEFIAQLLAQSKCMHIACECTEKEILIYNLCFKNQLAIGEDSPQLTKANILLE